MLRPPLAENRLRRLADGRVRIELKRSWSDGTAYLLFEPVEFREKLAALTPRPEINLELYHGVLASRARYANWGNRYKGQPHPPDLRSLQKLVKVR